MTDLLIPGENTEEDEPFRARIIERLNSRSFGGNVAQYVEEIEAIDGVGAVQVYPVWDGGGTVCCSILGADFLPASSDLVQMVQNAIDPPPAQGLGLGLAAHRCAGDRHSAADSACRHFCHADPCIRTRT